MFVPVSSFSCATRGQIEVRVVFDRPVSVTGSPRLLLDTGTHALLDATSEDGTEVRAGRQKRDVAAS